MATSIIASAQMFLDTIVRESYIQPVTSILHDPNKFEYSIYGIETRVREVRGGKASNYNPSVGFAGAGVGTGGSVNWSSFLPAWDRMFVDPVDSMTEMNSILAGMALSGVELQKQNWANLGGEIDATNIATWYSALPAGNILTNVTNPTDQAGVFKTLAAIRNKIFNAGYGGNAVVFIRSSIYTNIEAALQSGNSALANPHIVSINPTLDGKLEIQTEVLKYNNLFLVRTPDDRMNSKVKVLPDGGWEPDTADAAFKEIELFAIPFPAAATSIRHIVANFTVPMRFQGLVPKNLDGALETINAMYQGTVGFQNIGIDQTADQFKYMSRIVYGAMAFDTWKKTMFAVIKP